MVELYREATGEEGDRVADALRELVVAHRVHVLTPAQARAVLGESVTLPALVDDGKVVSGTAALNAHLEHLGRLMERWQRFQSDACYLGDDGETC